MLDSLFYMLLVGGIPVLFSYVHTYFNNDDKLWGSLNDRWFYAWVISMVLTIISYFWLAYYFIWETDNRYEPVLCATYVIFLSSAAQWSPMSLVDIHNNEKSWFVLINLYQTAGATLLLLIIAGLSEPNIRLIPAGVMFIHHFVFDAIIWYNGFLKK